MHPKIQAVITDSKDITMRFTAHRNSLAAGGLAYFVALAVVPAVIVVGALAGLMLGPDQVRVVMSEIAARTPIPVEVGSPFTEGLVSATEQASLGGLTAASLVGLVVAIFAASKVVSGLRLALDGVFETEPKRRGVVGRIIATLITLIGLLIAVGVLIALTVVPRVLAWLGFTDVHVFFGVGVIDWTLAALLTWLGTRWVLRHAPNLQRRIPWTALGPVVTTFWLLGLSAGLGAYVHLSTSLGSAIVVFGGIVVLMLWFYLSFLGLFIGAEIEAQRERQQSVADVAGVLIVQSRDQP